MRPIYLVKYWDKGSTAIGADQMAPALERLGWPARSVYAREIAEISDAVLVFVKRADFLDLWGARRRGNRCVLDVQDQLVFRRWLSHWFLYDGFIFRNRRQREDYAGWNRRAVSRTIYQHWDERYRPHGCRSEGLCTAYLGTERSLPGLWGRLPGVTFLGSDDWFARAGEFNAHLSLRERGREWRYKPNAKVATAAACDAVLLTTPDCSTTELLGDDYPFYSASADPAAVEGLLERAAEAVGGREWADALERLRAVREDTTLERTAGRYVEMFRELG